MDWKYQQFQQQIVLQQQPDVVLEATRDFIAESLAGWQVSDTENGFEAKGASATHGAIAHFHIQPGPSGTVVAVTLDVERAGPTGFMLFDIGGYYNRVIAKWLKGIEWKAYQKATGASEVPLEKQPDAPSPSAMRTTNMVVGCAALLFGLPLLGFFFSALIGLVTGNLFIPGSHGNPSVTIHGLWARLVGALVVAFFGYAASNMVKQSKKNHPKILEPRR